MQVNQRRPRGFGQAQAGLRRIAKAPAMRREDHRVRAKQAKQRADQQIRRDARCTAKAWMRQEGDIGEPRNQRLHGAEPGQQRRDQHRIDAFFARQPDLRAHRVEAARQAGHVTRCPSA